MPALTTHDFQLTTQYFSCAYCGRMRRILPLPASVITYTNPLVAVALGVLILGEELGPTSLIGLGAILAGSWLATQARQPAGRRCG